MLPKEEYISLLANLFQRGLCLDMIDIDGKQDSTDISDEERISYKAADEALNRVNLDELFDNAEILEIPDKYPEFYEYLRELQLERQEDGHGERILEDVSADEEVEEGEEESGLEEPQSLSTKDQVLKNIVGGEHTGNQRDSEKYRKGDEMRARLDEERREALARAAEQERYDGEHRMPLESRLEDERREAIARAEEQQRQREALRQKSLAKESEKAVNITNIHNKNKSADGVTNVVKGGIPDESTKHNENGIQYEPDAFNGERKTHGRQKIVSGPNVPISTSHESLYPRSESDYEREARTVNQPYDLHQQMRAGDNDATDIKHITDSTERYDKRDERPEPEKKDDIRSATNKYSSRITNDYVEKDSHIAEDINRTGSQVFEPKRENVEQISGHEELNSKSAQDVSHVVKGDTYSDFFGQDRPEVRDKRNRADAHNEPKHQSSRGSREGTMDASDASTLDRKSVEDTAQYHSEAGAEPAVDNTRMAESENKYVSDSYERSEQRDVGETYKRHQYDGGYGDADKENHLYEAENSHTNRNPERVEPNHSKEYSENFGRKKDADVDKYTESDDSIVGKRGEHGAGDYRNAQVVNKPNDSEPYKANSIPRHEKESVYDGSASSNPDLENAGNGTTQYKRETSESKKYINDSYGQAGQRGFVDNQSHKYAGEDTYASFKPKAYDAAEKKNPSSPSVTQNERKIYDAVTNSNGNIVRKENGNSHSGLSSGADKRPSAEPVSGNAKKYMGSSYEMAGQREIEHKERGYENLESQGFAGKPTGNVQPLSFNGTRETEKKYEKSGTRETSASEVTSRRQSAVDDLPKSERFQTDNIVRRPISQMPASHTASNQYPGLDGDSHQPSEAKTMAHDRQQDAGNHQDEKSGASAVEEVLRNRDANQENQDADRRKQTYSRDSYESSGQAPVDEKRKEPYGQGGTYSYVGKKEEQTDRKVVESRVLKSDKTDVVYPQKRDSSVAGESKKSSRSPSYASFSGNKEQRSELSLNSQRLTGDEIGAQSVKEALHPPYTSGNLQVDRQRKVGRNLQSNDGNQQKGTDSLQNGKNGASAVEEVLRNRDANQENQDVDRISGNVSERKQTYSRDSYESSGQAPVDEKRKDSYGQGGTSGYIGKKEEQAARKVIENRVLKSDKTDVVYPQKRDSSAADESKINLRSPSCASFSGNKEQRSELSPNPQRLTGDEIRAQSVKEALHPPYTPGNLQVDGQRKVERSFPSNDGNQQKDTDNYQNGGTGANAVEEVLRDRTVNQEKQDADRLSGGTNERKQTYSRDSYESSGQAPVDEKRKDSYGQGGTSSYIGRKEEQAARKVIENRVLKSDKTDVVYPQKRDSSAAGESKNGLQSIKKKDETKVIEIPVPSGSGQTHTVRSTVAGAAAVTAVAAALAAREAAKTASEAAKTATDRAEGMVMLKDTSIMSASELAAYASAVNSAQAATQISGKQIADSYALAGQADAETIKMNVEQALANAREIAAGTRSGLNVPGAIFGTSGPTTSDVTKNFDITRPSIHTLGIPGVVKSSNFTDVGMFVLKEGNQVTISRNGKSKKYTVRSDGTIRIDGIVLNVYSVDNDRAFVGWKNAAVYGGKVYTATGTVLDISTDGSTGTTKTLAGLEFHIKRDVKVNARQMTMAMTIAPALNQPITDADFVKVGDKFISNKVTESYSGLLYQKALNKGKVSQLIFKQKMAMHSVFRAQLLAGAAANMRSIDLKLDLNTLVANYDKILTSISGNSRQFYQMNVFLETLYLSDIERQYLFDAKAKLKRLGFTENTDTLKELLAGGGLSPEVASAITDYLNVYENTREKIIRKGILGDQSIGDFKVERAFYAAALPYVLQARGLPSDKKALKKLLKAGTTSKETKELIRNVFKLQRRMFLLNLTETTLTAYAKGAVKAVKNGYRKIKSLANRYMGDDYTMRGLLMMESIIVGSAMKAYRTSRKIKWMRENAGRLLNSSIRLGKSIGNAAVAGYRGAKAGIHAVHMGGRTARKGFQYLRKNGLKKTLKKGVKKLRMKGTKVVRKGVLKVAKVTQKAAIKVIQAAIKLIQTLISALVAALGPIIIALIIVLAIILCIISYVKNAGNEVYYDAGDEDTTEVLQEMVDVLTLCHSSFRSELSNHFGGTSSTGSASGTDGSTMNAPQLQKGDSSKVQGLYDVTEGTWWNYEFTYQYIHGNWDTGTRQQALDNKVTVEGNGNYAVVDQNGTKMYMAAFGSYWGKVGDVLKVEFNKEFAIGSQPASNTMYIIIADEKAWKDTGYPAEQEGIYGHHLGSHRDFAEFIGYGSKPAGLNGSGLIPVNATNMGSILDGTFDSSTIGTGAAASSVSVNADILYRQEIDQDVYRDILNRDKNIYYTFPEEQKVPDGITPTPTPEGYVKADAKGEVYGFYNNNQELISMVMAMFDFEASSSTSTKSTIISKKDASGLDEAKTNDTYQKGMTDKEVDDKWKLIEYLNEKGLDLTNYKAGGYDDLRYSALVGLFNASHIITGTAVKQYHAGPDGTINPVYNDDGRIVGQNNTDGMSYQVPVMETKTRQVKNEHGDIQIVYYTGYKTDSDGNIVYETKYAPCPGHTKYSGAVITLHFDSLLNLDDWWEKNIYRVDDFDKENPNYESSDASADTYRAKENTLKRTIQYIKKPDYYKSLSGTCSEGENSTTDSFNPGTWDGNQAKVAKEVYEFLTTKMSRKLTSEQAMGVLVNIYRECSFNYTEEETGGTGYGLTQWSFGRRTKLVQWCNANGYQYNTLEGQLKRLECEFTEDTSDWSPSGIEGFYACTTAREAGEFFITNYERPGAQYKAQRLAEMDSDIATIQAMLQS